MDMDGYGQECIRVRVSMGILAKAYYMGEREREKGDGETGTEGEVGGDRRERGRKRPS